jgi:hypothetical protein
MDKYECVRWLSRLHDDATDTFFICTDSFTPEGNGCRHWCAIALENLGTGGFVDPTVGQMFKEYETQEAAKWGVKFPMPRFTGMFYV